MTAVGHLAGFAAEDIISRDYVQRGHSLAAQRWRGKAGEIDLVLRNGDGVVFVEVKKSKDFAKAATRLQRRQMDRLCAAASEFLANEPNGQLTNTRFDLALVDSAGAIKVIENAFMES